MAVTQTGSISHFNIGTANTGTVTSTITVPADAQLAVCAVSGYNNAAGWFSTGSMTFTKGGVDSAMTAVTGGDSNTARSMVCMFWIVSPDTGTNKTCKWDWASTDTADAGPIVDISFWTGLDTSSPIRDSDGAQAAGTPYTTPTLTAQSGDLIVAWAGGDTSAEGTINSWSNLTELQESTRNAAGQDGAYATGSPSGNTTVAASTDTNFNDGGIVAIVIKPAAASAASSLVWQPPSYILVR